MTALLVTGACGRPVPSPVPLGTGAIPSQGSGESPTAPASPSATGHETTQPETLVIARVGLSLAAPISRAVAFGLPSGDILLCGGLNPSGTTTTSIVRLELAGGTIAPAGQLAVPVHDAGGASLGADAFILGGGSRVPGSIVQRLDGSGGSVPIGHLPMVRADLAAVDVDGEIVVVAGGTSARPDPSVLASTDGRHFRTVASLALAVRYAAVVAVDGVIVVVGGSTPTGDSNVIQVVDPRTGSVRILGRLPYGLSHAVGLSIDGQVFVAGGRRSGRAQDVVWRIDPGTGRVTRAGRLPFAESDATGAVVAGVGYLIGGEGATGSFSAIVSLRLG